MSLSDAELRELTGEDDLGDVENLVMRSKGLQSIDSIVARLPSLSVLSISHNVLTDISCLSTLSNLQHLNVGFNALTSIQGLSSCTNLRKLYLSSNRIRELHPLDGLTRLEVLSLFKNDVASLGLALVTLARLQHLRELDMEANPCCREDDYRARLIASLPGLSKLDGDEVNEADAAAVEDLPEDALADLRASMGAGATRLGATGRLEATSSSSSSQLRMSVARPPLPAALRPSTAPPASPTGAAGQQHTNAISTPRLFRDEFLDSNPILLEYLAKGALGPLPSETGSISPLPDSAAQDAAEAAGGSLGGRRSFADRLRATAATMHAAYSAGLQPTNEAMKSLARGGGGAGGDRPGSGGRAAEGAAPVLSRAAIERALAQGGSPMDLIRALVQCCEALQGEKEALKSQVGRLAAEVEALRSGRPSTPGSAPERSSTSGGRAPGSSAPSQPYTASLHHPDSIQQQLADLQRENARLKLESRNVFWLHEENKELRKELEGMRGGGRGGGAVSEGAGAFDPEASGDTASESEVEGSASEEEEEEEASEEEGSASGH